MPTLWIFVRFVTIPEDAPKGEQLYLHFTVGKEKASTQVSTSTPPSWDSLLCFESALQSHEMTVDLRSKGFLWDQTIASLALPLKFVPYTSLQGDGDWHDLTEKGSNSPSKEYRILMDLRFDFPEGLTEEERAVMESKLVVLEEEVQKIDEQYDKIKEGVIEVPVITNDKEADREIPEDVVIISDSAREESPLPQSDLSSGMVNSSHHSTETENQESFANLFQSVESSPEEGETTVSEDIVSFGVVQEDETAENTEKEAKGKSLESQRSVTFEDSIQQTTVMERKSNSLERQSPLTFEEDTWKTREKEEKEKSVEREPSKKPEKITSLQRLPSSPSVLRQLGKDLFDFESEPQVITPSRKYTMGKKSVRRTFSRPFATTHGFDDDLVHTVYRKGIQALIYPPSTDEDQHSFEVWSAHKPTSCAECNSILLGIARQGYKCKKCGLKCHERCATLVNADCSIHAARRTEMKKFGAAALDDKFLRNHVISRMDRQILINKKDQLQLLGECFGALEAEHEQLLEKAKDEVLQFLLHFKAVIKVQVIQAEKLAVREDVSNSIYVSVSIGNQRRRTKAFRERTNPAWHEEFSFDCDNAMDRIKVRVWNESDNTVAKISQKLTKESDQFLGEKIIEVRNLGEATDLWHKLDKRTNQSIVSGSIRLVIYIQEENKGTTIPYHELYMYFHSKLFNHAHLTQELPLVKADISHGEEPFEMLLPPAYQQLANDFSKRFSIDPLTMAIAHFKCLSQRYILPQALEIMCILLREIKEEVVDRDEQCQKLTFLDSGTSRGLRYKGKKHGRLASILQQLLNSLRIDLQSYREVFPADDMDKLEEFSYAINLVELIVECQTEALDESQTNASDIVEDSMKQCGKVTFEILMQECLAATATKYPAGSEKTANPREFFLGLMQLLVAAILEDRNDYEPCVAKYCKFSLSDLTAIELWHILGERLHEMLMKQRDDETFPPSEYINLLLFLNQVHNDYIKKQGLKTSSDIEYPVWFEFFVQKWIKSFEEKALDFATKAVANDKAGQFASLENKPLSSSVFDIFYLLHEGNKKLDKLSCGNVELHYRYFHRLALVIQKVLTHYIALLTECIQEFQSDPPCLFMLLNDIQHTRLNLQQLFEAMGRQMNAGEECSEVLTDVQKYLAKQLTVQSQVVARSLYPTILLDVKAMKTEIFKVKGVVKGQLTKRDVSFIMNDMMTHLSQRGSKMVEVCDERVLEKLVKELWLVLVDAFQEVLLPKASPNSDGHHSMMLGLAGGQNFTPIQCAYLEQVLEVIKDFFMSLEKVRLKSKGLSQSLVPLKKILSMYQSTTNTLIAQFVLRETEQDAGPEGKENCGEITIELETKIHPGSQELGLTVHVLSVSGLKPIQGSTVQKPFVEIYLIGPGIHGLNRRYKTAHGKAVEDKFVFTQSMMTMTIPSAVSFEKLELQIMVKTQGFFAGGQTLGLTVLQLRNHLCQNHSLQLELVNKLKITPDGEDIISVLAQRNDELAKEFISLKQEARKHEREDLLDKQSSKAQAS